MSSPARRWLFAAVVLLLTALFVRLGVWQIDRLEGRRAEVADRRAQLELPPVRITAAGVERRLGIGAPPADSAAVPGPDGRSAPFLPADSAAWRRVVAEGRFDYAREAVLSPRSRQGAPAVYVVTPLVIADSAAVPVIRGSIPAPDGLHAPLARARPVWARSDSAARDAVTGHRRGPADDAGAGAAGRGEPAGGAGDGADAAGRDERARRFATRPAAPLVTVGGTAYPPPGGEPVAEPDSLHAAGGVHPALPRLDLARLDSIWPWRTAGFYVRADSTTERIPPAEGEMALLRPVPPPPMDEGPHRMYAIQWFAFAAIALVGGGIWLWRDRGDEA